MAEFLVEAQDADGQTVVLTVHADGPSQAMKSVERDGYRAIALRSDPSLSGPVIKTEEDRALLESVAPEERVALASASDTQMMMLFARQAARQLWWVYAGAVGFAVYQFVVNGALAWLIGTPLVLVAGTFALAFFGTKVGPQADHIAYLAAISEGRWADALRHAEKLAPKLDDVLVAFMRAKVFAIMGDVEDALEHVRPFEGKTPDESYYAQMADLFDAAREFEAAEKALHKALAAQPDNPTLLLDLARLRLEHHGDVAQAKAFLDRVDRAAVISTAKFVVQLIEGLIALESKNAKEAHALLEGVHTEVSALEPRAMWIGFTVLTQMYLALAHAEVGDRDAARALYESAAPTMRICKRDYLLARVESALGI